MVNRRKSDPLKFQRCIQAKELARFYAHRAGAPASIGHQAACIASREVLLGCTVWRAYRRAMAWLDAQADATGWWGTPA